MTSPEAKGDLDHLGRSPKDLSYLEDQEWSLEQGKNAYHLHHPELSRPFVVPVFIKTDFDEDSSDKGLSKLYIVDHLTATIGGIKELVHVDYPDTPISHIRVKVSTEKRIGRNVQDEEMLCHLGHVADVAEVEKARREGISLSTLGHHVWHVSEETSSADNLSLLYTHPQYIKAQKNTFIDGKSKVEFRLFLNCLHIELLPEGGNMTDKSIYDAYIDTIFTAMDLEDSHADALVNLQDFVQWMENTTADDRPVGPLSEKDAFTTHEATALMRQISADKPGSTPTPFTKKVFKRWCEQFITFI